MINLKRDKHINHGSSQIPTSNYLAKQIKQNIDELPFADYFNETTLLVPAPSSSSTKPNFLRITERLANALVMAGLGKHTKLCLERMYDVPKSSRVSANDRPKAAEHYNSIKAQKILTDPRLSHKSTQSSDLPINS